MIKGKSSFDSSAEMTDFIDACEKSFEQQLKDVSEAVISSGSSIITICGPSCSGKTTTANKLVKNLSLYGKKIHVISFDDFYLDRKVIEEMCRKKGVETEFESASTLDLELLRSVIQSISSKDPTSVPRYSFAKGERSGYIEYDISDDDMFIFEGIQALYPEVNSLWGDTKHFSIYICVENGIEFEDVGFDKESVRFLRRVIRDYKHRASNMEMTYKLWKNVRANEEANIFPNIGNADHFINSVLAYELNVIKNDAYEIFDSLQTTDECYNLSLAFKDKLDRIQTISEDFVPSESVLREFID